eukprot:3720365-Amphidinium_carterae.1
MQSSLFFEQCGAFRWPGIMACVRSSLFWGFTGSRSLAALGSAGQAMAASDGARSGRSEATTQRQCDGLLLQSDRHAQELGITQPCCHSSCILESQLVDCFPMNLHSYHKPTSVCSNGPSSRSSSRRICRDYSYRSSYTAH